MRWSYVLGDRAITIIVTAAFAAIFWSLRYHYWSITFEEPFSDMADYVSVARQIASQFFFGFNEAFYSYWTPVTPSFIAISILLGGDNYQTIFRYLVQTVTFFGSLVLAYEIIKLTGRRWLGGVLLLVVALARPSIFWSLKLGTETVSEALLICAIGVTLRALRTRSSVWTVASGVFCVLLALNRPQFMPSVFAVAACFLFAGFGICMQSDRLRAQHAFFIRDSTRLWQTSYFIVGAIIVWSPWIMRNYLHYGAFIPTATSGFETFVWENGGAPLQPGRYQELHLSDGTIWRDFRFTAIQESVANSSNDYERSKKFRLLAMAWLAANWKDLPTVFGQRLVHFISHNGTNGLTKVPRDHLFPSSNASGISLDYILLDKNPVICAFAIGGIILLIIRYGIFGYAMASFCLLPWFVLAAMIGFERTVESLICVTIWLAIYFAAMMLEFSISSRKAY